MKFIATGLAGGALAVAVGALSLEAASSTALAPEPVALSGALGSLEGSTAPGYYVQISLGPTTVTHWPSTPRLFEGAVAGAPCSTVALSAGAVTTDVLVLYPGDYVACQHNPKVTTVATRGAQADGPYDATGRAPGHYIDNGDLTTVLKWSPSPKLGTGLVAGEPCSPSTLSVGKVTYAVIVALDGGYYKCA